MNRIYRLVWNTTLRCWKVVGEHSRSRRKTAAATRALGAALGLALAGPAFAAQEPPPAADDTEADPALDAAHAFATAGASLSSFRNVLIGGGTSFNSTEGVAIGLGSVTAFDGIGIGAHAKAVAGGVAIGTGASTSVASGGTALGRGARIDALGGGGAVALGHRAYVGSGGNAAVSVGSSASATGSDATALGAVARAQAARAIAIGAATTASHADAVALGAGAVTTGTRQVSVGNASLRRKIVNVADATLSSSSAEAVTGRQLHATQQSLAAVTRTADVAATTAGTAQAEAAALAARLAAASPTLGVLAVASSDGVALGKLARAEGGTASTAVGRGAQGFNTGGVALGSDARAGVNADGEREAGLNGGVAVGASARSGNGAVASGLRASAVADRAVAVGNDALAAATHAVALGYKATAGAAQSTALGRASSASAQYATALGNLSVASGTSATALGERAVASHAGAVALGNGSVTQADHQVSVGNASLKRRIVNLADGTLSSNSTEAVSGRQLHATNQSVSAATTLANAAHTVGNAAQTTANVAQSAANTAQTSAERAGTDATQALSAVSANQTALGRDALASGTHANAVGYAAHASGGYSNAMGFKAAAAGSNAVSVGTLAAAAGETSVALGNRASVHAGAGNSVALGSGAVASEANTVSVGHAGNRRRIVNVADGALRSGSNEVVTGGQLFATHARLDEQDTRIGAHADDLYALRDAFDNFRPDLGDVVRFGEDGTVALRGARLVELGEGELSATSREAVTGSMLFRTHARIEELEAAQQYLVVGYDGLSTAAEAGPLATAMGSDTRAMAEGATAVGSFAEAHAVNSVALGRAAWVSETAAGGVALGEMARVWMDKGLALGHSSRVLPGAADSVALGNGSIATEAYEVSVGGGMIRRRITNARNGIHAHDLTTVDQLSGVVRALGGGAAFAADGSITAPSYAVHGTTVSTLGEVLTTLDSAVQANRRDLGTLDQRFDQLFEPTGSHSDGPGQLRLAGAQGRVLGNVADGLIAAGSRDAVNGGQLHALQTQVNGRIDGLQAQLAGEGTEAGTRSTAVAQAAPPAAPFAQEAPPAEDVPVRASADTRTPQPQADAPLPEVDSRAVDEALNRANAYTDQALAGVDRRLDRLDRRLNRMAAMGSAQAAMAMNTAGLQTYNRLGAGVGHAEGEAALAVGYQRVLNARGSATFSLNGAFTNSGERTLGVGVGVGW